MFENLFIDLRAMMRNGCWISGMDCSDVKFNIDEDDIRSHKSGVYLVFKNKELIYIGYTGYFNDSDIEKYFDFYFATEMKKLQIKPKKEKKNKCKNINKCLMAFLIFLFSCFLYNLRFGSNNFSYLL